MTKSRVIGLSYSLLSPLSLYRSFGPNLLRPIPFTMADLIVLVPLVSICGQFNYRFIKENMTTITEKITDVLQTFNVIEDPAEFGEIVSAIKDDILGFGKQIPLKKLGSEYLIF